ncbi:MAG: hypothetical protein ACKVQA_12975, partial [Burkholderiales bacterium]
MSTSVTPIPRRLHSKKFAELYPRFIRQVRLVPAVEIDAAAEKFTPVPPGYELALALPPKARWSRQIELNAAEFLKRFNQLLIYRSLKLLYGTPDVVAANFNRENETAHPVDWSFTVKLGDTALCEIRSKHCSRIHIDIWAPRLRTVEKRQGMGSQVNAFCSALDDFLEKNSHLWDPSVV